MGRHEEGKEEEEVGGVAGTICKSKSTSHPEEEKEGEQVGKEEGESRSHLHL